MEDFKKLLEMAEGSRFLKGENSRNWSVTFDWLVKDSNMEKVLEGNYEDKQSCTATNHQQNKDIFTMIQEGMFDE